MVIEKSMDYFESGIKTVLEANDFPVLEHIDALSLRCFAFAKEGEPENWYRPVVSVEEAVERLEKITGMEGCWEVRRYQKGQHLPGCVCMVGPIKESLFLPDLKAYYYHGYTGYFCFKRNDKDTFWAWDFGGVPAAQIDRSELNGILEENLPFLVWMKPWRWNGPWEYRLDYRRLLQEGLRFHKDCTLKEHKKLEEHKKESKCGDFGSQYASLRYALMNYGIQMRKMTAFVEAAIGLEEPIKKITDELWAQLVRIGLDADVGAIPDWEHRIWSVIFKHAENKGIIL